MADEERIVTVRGEGGTVFEVDLAKNPWAEEQIAAKRLKLLSDPQAEAESAAAECRTLLRADPVEVAEWLAGAKPAEVVELLEEAGDAGANFADALFGFEQSGKARKTMLAAIEAFLEDATEPPTEED